MEPLRQRLPLIGDVAPAFEVPTEKGLLQFPQYSEGCWCIFFAHPANFTSAWTMFSAFLAMKERWLNERNTKVLALANEPLRQNNQWADKARRFIGIYLKAPVIEDLDFRIAKLYGLASGRRPQPGCDRLALIIDPEGVVRMIIHRPLPNIESALLDIERELDRLQGKIQEEVPPVMDILGVAELSDAVGDLYKPDPAYFTRKPVSAN
ncbi:MAG: redoxin domain-containing protein [Saprospiraceae bacterium]|nr:redoxin domain-containing protein [Saprospiraceae bacterium]